MDYLTKRTNHLSNRWKKTNGSSHPRPVVAKRTTEVEPSSYGMPILDGPRRGERFLDILRPHSYLLRVTI